jgi:hypothetical protein
MDSPYFKFETVVWKILDLNANSIEPGQTAWICRLTMLYFWQQRETISTGFRVATAID